MASEVAHMNVSKHPLWLVGFRPFFTLACLAGSSLPILWALIFLGLAPALPAPVGAVQWHAHEMFFGFGWAVLAGFLLTATKNWVKVRGFHGGSLVFLAAAWLFERVGMWFGQGWPAWLFQLSSYLFLVSIVGMILWTLVRHRKQDSFAGDNMFFVLVLPLFLLAKPLLLSADFFPVGWSMVIGLFRMAFLLMLERTVTQFMQGVYKATLLRNKSLDTAIKLLGVASIFESVLPPLASAALALLLAVLLTFRFAYWKPALGFKRLDIGIMYLGYVTIVIQLLIEFVDATLRPSWVGAVSVHVFGLGVMGFIIPAMLIRISKGHTGRKVLFDPIDRLVLWVMIAALGFRTVVPQLYPAGYPYWITLAAACWLVGFATLAWRYIPFLVQPRVDGKEH
jgi:uncharacterized protein involved in response to NO